MATATSLEAESSGLVNTLQGHVDDIRTLLQCGICIRPLYEPFTIACGHTFCYSCLSSWFAGGRSKRTCPDCRAPVKTQPAPAYLVRAVVKMFTSHAELLDTEETTSEHKKNHDEEIEKLDKDKANTDPQKGGLFGGLFATKPAQLKPVIDIDDGIMRCPNCSWELEDGQHCAGCGYTYRPDSEGSDNSDSELSDTDYDSILDGDDEDDDDEDEDDIDEPQVTRSRQPNYPFHTYDQPSLGALFRDLHPHPFYFTAFRPPLPGGSLSSPWDPPRPPTDYASEEEMEEEGDDYYEESFIDDEEPTQLETEASDSDHTTVVGRARPRNPNSPIVQYPQVLRPASAAEPEDYDWNSEDEDGLAELRGQWVDENESSEGGSEVSTRDRPNQESQSSDGEDEESDEESRRRLREAYGFGVAIPPIRYPDYGNDEESEESEENSSSPPRPRVSRTRGSSAHNAIAIDDSDEEEPVGP
ncbi:hypothetical protein N7490_003519, partial [Penicillium lividum]